MNIQWEWLTEQNIVWWMDPKSEQMDFFLSLLADKWFVEELKTFIWWVKPNLKFYWGEKWAKLLALILDRFSDRYRILDAKCSDGINTEKAVINTYRNLIDAITIAPASWDDLSYIELLQNSDTWKKVDVISMWAMSFPGTISDLILWSFDQQKVKIARNIKAGVTWIVMWATAYNTDIVKELGKIKERIESWNVEYVCLKWYSDEKLIEWIWLRNKLFKEVLWFIGENDETKILTPGFWRQWGSSDFFIPEFDYARRTYFNAWSDIVKDLEGTSIKNARSEVLKRLEAFLWNIRQISSTD